LTQVVPPTIGLVCDSGWIVGHSCQHSHFKSKAAEFTSHRGKPDGWRSRLRSVILGQQEDAAKRPLIGFPYGPLGFRARLSFMIPLSIRRAKPHPDYVALGSQLPSLESNFDRCQRFELNRVRSNAFTRKTN